MKNVRDCSPAKKGTPVLKIVQNAPVAGNTLSILDDLVAALEIEIETYIQSHIAEVDDDGHRLVVRNGSSPARSIKTGAGSLDVEQPRVNDRRIDPDTGERQEFSSASTSRRDDPCLLFPIDTSDVSSPVAVFDSPHPSPIGQ
jgi:hypothetical protein